MLDVLMLQIVDILMTPSSFSKRLGKLFEKTWMKFNHVYRQNREGAGSGVGGIDVMVECMSAHAQKLECNGVKTFVHSPFAHIKATCTKIFDFFQSLSEMLIF